MAKAVPTVLATSPAEYDQMLNLARKLSPRVHVDISDGQFTDNATISVTQVHVPEDTQLDVHLMVKDPAAIFESTVSLHPKLVIYHAESEGDLEGIINQTRSLGVKAGVAILPTTEVTAATKLIEASDHVLIFTGQLGHNGGQFAIDQLRRVSTVRAIKPGLEISVDGGVNDQNAAIIAMEGVDVLYTGGFIQNAEDPRAAFNSIQQAVVTE
jgi:ribulose-phosphate 3-epimerase